MHGFEPEGGGVAQATKPETEAEGQTEQPSTTSSMTFATPATVPPVAPSAAGPAGPTASQLAFGGLPGEQRTPATQQELTKKYGVRPRQYAGAVDGTNWAELQMRQYLPEVVAFLNQRARSQGLDVTLSVAELTTNLLMEGVILVINQNMTEGIDGFGAAGIDTFLDRARELAPWLHPCIARDRVTPARNTNERGESVNSITNLTLMQVMYASGAMWAAAKTRFSKWLRRNGQQLSDLSDTEQMYWVTWYYNAGEGKAEPELKRVGVAGAHRKWTQPDDAARYGRSAHYNATLRTATYELTRDSAMDHGELRPIGQEDAGSARAAIDQRRAQLLEDRVAMPRRIQAYELLIKEDEAELAKTTDPALRANIEKTIESNRKTILSIKARLAAIPAQLAEVETIRKTQLPAEASTPRRE